MEEFLFLAAGAFFCVLPVGLIIVTALRGGRLKDLQRQVDEHHSALHALGDQNVRLHHRVLELEALAAQGAPAPAPAPAAAHASAPVAAQTPGEVPRWQPPQPSPAEMVAQPAAPVAQPVDPSIGAPSVQPSEAAQPAHPTQPAAQPIPATANPAPQEVDQRWQPAQDHASNAAASAAASAASMAASEVTPAAAGGGGAPPSATRPAPAGGSGDGPFPRAEKKPIQWEEWIGVRGLAALAAMVLVLAGLYFFKLSIDKNWITPAMRFAIGIAVGVGCIGAAELRLRKRYVVLSNWLTGAGISILYISAWAGKALYDLYPTLLAAILMAAVTAACVVLAQARRSATVAILGLCGGFITPMALSTGSDHPIPLFGYLLILNAAMLYVAFRQRWAWLAAFALGATALYELGWLFGRMHDGTRWIGAVALSIFALLYLLVPLGQTASPAWRRIRAAAVLIPILLSIGVGFRTDLAPHLGVTALQLIALAAAAAWLARREEMSTFAGGAAIACQFALVGTVVAHLATASAAWMVAGISFAIVLVFHLSAEIGAAPARERAANAAAASMVGALLLGFLMMNVPPVGVPAAVVFGVFPAVFAMRLNVLKPAWTALSISAMTLGAIIVASLFTVHSGVEVLPGPTTNLGAMVLLAFAAQLAGLLTRRGPLAVRKAGDHAAAAVSIILSLGVAWVVREGEHPSLPLHLSRVLLLLATIFAAGRSGSGGWLTIGAMVFAFGDLTLALRVDHGHGVLLGAMLAKVVLFAAAPFVFPKLASSHWSWRGAGMSALLFLLPLAMSYSDVFGEETIGILPLAMSVLFIVGVFILRARPAPEPVTLSATVWMIGAAAALITIAIPMQLKNEWVTIGWALEAMVFTALWRRYDHAGLKYTALSLASLVFIRLVMNPEVLDYQLRGSLRVVNWISYTYLLPAAALFGAQVLMSNLEVPRRRKWEPGPVGRPIVAPTFGGIGIILIFVWLNLMVFDFFATGPNLTIPTDRLPARDLSTSMAWALYAIGLLVGGVLRKSKGLRYASLTLLLFTVLKVFLYDLGNLQDLYRVASLVGLALTLIVISLFYKRFVFTDTDEPEAGPPGDAPPPTHPGTESSP